MKGIAREPMRVVSTGNPRERDAPNVTKKQRGGALRQLADYHRGGNLLAFLDPFPSFLKAEICSFVYFLRGLSSSRRAGSSPYDYLASPTLAAVWTTQHLPPPHSPSPYPSSLSRQCALVLPLFTTEYVYWGCG